MLFNRKTKQQPNIEPVNFDSVLDYLTGLSDKNYTTICQVALIHRKANKKSSKILGVKDKPTTFINEPAITIEPNITLEKVKIDYLDTPDLSKPKKAKKWELRWRN